MPVDRAARTQLAEQLSALIHGGITNHEFDWSSGQIHSDDGAVRAVRIAADVLYDDFETTRFVGQSALPPITLRNYERAVLFLRTDLEYEWPHDPGKPPSTGLAVALFIFALIGPGVFLVGLDHDPIVGEMLMLAGAALMFPLAWWAMTVKTKHRKYDEWLAAGDITVWPFNSRADYYDAAGGE